ncbi:NAD(P)-binding protein [Durotheca rogersii]|uniref:NAD(P)-binding protein n=1 Tax=Durotheca rogersii TaxID=419775 RepID=UPI00221F25EE|nr:NAD(P)-binding protein [Durotheca rogersii]KAI5867518.1 NAD(P)-binding protein [Durotheca rogersii]
MDVTGHAFVIGGSGIGKACALAFAKYGSRRIVVADINLEAAEAAVAACRDVALDATFHAEAIAIDVTAEESVKAAIARAQEVLGRIDYCVNSAGVAVRTACEVAEANVDEFDAMLRVNVAGPFLVTRAMSAVMKSQSPNPVDPSSQSRGVTRGAIVNLGSASSFAATPRMIQYTTAKHAVAGLTKNAALDNAAYGIRVNSVCPSWVDTPMVRQAMVDVPNLRDMIETSVPLGRIALAEEVADALARHITGHNDEGKSVFLSSDNGDHYRIMGEKQAVANILYSTRETPVDLNDNVDIEKAKSQEPPLHYHNGTVVRMIDFAPDVESPMHRAVSLDYGIVVEGTFKLILDSGEERIMHQGDVSIQRATAHKWHNISGNGTQPGRMMWILLDCKDVYVKGKKMEGYLGELTQYYEGREP